MLIWKPGTYLNEGQSHEYFSTSKDIPWYHKINDKT